MNIMKVERATPGLARLPSGAALQMPGLNAVPESSLRLGIRPEDIELVAPGTPGSIEMPVEFVEELGAGHLVHGEFEGAEFVVALPGAIEVVAGGRLHMRFPPEALHMFDAVSGLRLDGGEKTSGLSSGAVREFA
jgi:sn-glycerol 3-phosphate transport system ATP-binding protein